MPDDSLAPLVGGCGCGGVRFAIAAPLVAAAYCHCTRCQRRSGTAAAASARVVPGSVAVTTGRERLRGWWPGDGMEKVFCGDCGSALFARDRASGEVAAVRLGAIDGDPRVRPSAHRFVAYAAPWEPIHDDGLPRFAEGAPVGAMPSAREQPVDSLFVGLRTVIYPAPDLSASKAWFTNLLGLKPYFDEPFYVGYSVAGYELALDPDGDPTLGPITYWGVADADVALAHLVDAGATSRGEAQDVGGGIRVATVVEPGGSVLGIIENPNFALPESSRTGPGPGR